MDESLNEAHDDNSEAATIDAEAMAATEVRWPSKRQWRKLTIYVEYPHPSGFEGWVLKNLSEAGMTVGFVHSEPVSRGPGAALCTQCMGLLMEDEAGEWTHHPPPVISHKATPASWPGSDVPYEAKDGIRRD